MTEQERSNKFRADMENALHQDRSLTMIAQTIWELTKEYKDAEVEKAVAAKDKEITGYKVDIFNLKAENKRLREFAQQCQKSPENLVKMVWFGNGQFDYCDLVPLQEAAAAVLSPTDEPEPLYSPAPEPKYVKVRFDSLKIGQEFECYGDDLINYDYPKICKCIKLSKSRAREIEGISFFVSASYMVMVAGN